MQGRSRFTENDPRNAAAYDTIERLLGEFSVDAARDDLGITPLRTVTLHGPFRYGIPLPPAEGSAGDPVMAMDLPHDADQIVGPGETAAVRTSLSAAITEPEGRDVVAACIHTTYAAMPPPPSTYRTNPSPYCACNDLLDGTESYLVITSPATWRDTGGKRLAIGAGSSYPVLQCRDLGENLTVICDAKSLAGEYPELVVDNDAAGTAFATFNGGHFCRASDLFASLSPDWSALHLWNGKKWVPYAEAADGPAPGASDYLIAPVDMLCLIVAQTAAVSDQELANPS